MNMHYRFAGWIPSLPKYTVLIVIRACERMRIRDRFLDVVNLKILPCEYVGSGLQPS
jgi:hypothetical protein